MSNRFNPAHSTRRPQSRSSLRGTAILPALIVVVMVATLSMVFVQVSLSKNKEQRGSVDSKRAFYMAEAGLAEGFNGLCMGKSGNVASEDVPAEFGGGLFWTKATELGSGRVKLESTGLCGAGRATLSLTCERKSDNVGALGFFGGQDIVVEAGALIDSYDSRLGTYASQALTAMFALPGARVGGNNDITVQGTFLKPTMIFGDVNPGPLGTLFRPASGTIITGSKAPSPAVVTFPAVKPPTIPSSGNLDVTTNKTLSTGAYGLGDLRVRSNMTLALTGPQVIVTRRLRVEPDAKLTINATDGPVMLYVLDGMKFETGSFLQSLSTDPRGITIQVVGVNGVDVDADGIPDAPVDLQARGDFHGSIYSPTSGVILPAGLNVHGSVVSNHLTIKSGGKLHFDRAFASTDAANGSEHLLGWHIVELPNVAAVNLRFDAVADLYRQGITPRKPFSGHFNIGVTPY